MIKARTQTIAKALRILCAIALLSVGFAHKPVMAAVFSPAEITAYQLPDGSFADLCISHDVAKHQGKMDDRGCDACRLSAAILLPLAPSIVGEILAVSNGPVLLQRQESVRHRLYPPSSGPRAPPHILMTV